MREPVDTSKMDLVLLGVDGDPATKEAEELLVKVGAPYVLKDIGPGVSPENKDPLKRRSPTLIHAGDLKAGNGCAIGSGIEEIRYWLERWMQSKRLEHKAYLIVWARMDRHDSLPVLLGAGIYSEPSPTLNMHLHPLVMTYVSSWEGFAEARDKLKSKLQWYIDHPETGPFWEWVARNALSNGNQ